MGNPYRALFALPGAKAFVGASFLGRMPMSMEGIAIVLLVSSVTGSYGTAGAVSATSAIGYAVISPIMGRLTDRLGQHRVLVPMVIGNASSVVVLIVLTHFAPVWTFFPAALFVGLTTPSVGSFARARWSFMLSGSGGPTLETAYSFESVVDEVVFIAGPTLASVLATSVHPASGVGASGLCLLIGCLGLAVQRRTSPPARPRAEGSRAGSAITAPGMRVLVLVVLILGSLFGSIEVSIIAFAQEHGQRGLAGVILAIFAFGSMVSGLWYGMRSWRAGVLPRFLVGLAGLAAGLTLLLLANSVALLAALIFLAGLAISPTTIPAFGLVERLVPGSLLTEGFGWVSTAAGFGIAVGAPVAGRLIDAYGARTALLFPVGGAWLAATVAVAGSARLRPRTPCTDVT